MADETDDDVVKDPRAIAPRTGEVVFEGDLAALSVPEIIQMACVGRQRLAVEVWCDALVGVIVVDDGDVLAARSHDEAGDPAFVLLAQPRAGRFRAFHATADEAATFDDARTTRRWHDLLLDATTELPPRDSLTNERGSVPDEAPTRASTPRTLARTFENIMKDAAVAYLRRDYDTAERLLHDCLAMRPDDAQVREQLARIESRRAP